jgi:hypothetical protein
MTRQYPELPELQEMWVPALVWMKDRDSYSSDDLRAYLAEYFHCDTTLRFPEARRSAFNSYVGLLLARMTLDSLHIRTERLYRLTDRGRKLAQKYAAMPAARSPQQAA